MVVNGRPCGRYFDRVGLVVQIFAVFTCRPSIVVHSAGVDRG
jgi:hypothetical protein